MDHKFNNDGICERCRSKRVIALRHKWPCFDLIESVQPIKSEPAYSTDSNMEDCPIENNRPSLCNHKMMIISIPSMAFRVIKRNLNKSAVITLLFLSLLEGIAILMLAYAMHRRDSNDRYDSDIIKLASVADYIHKPYGAGYSDAYQMMNDAIREVENGGPLNRQAFVDRSIELCETGAIKFDQMDFILFICQKGGKGTGRYWSMNTELWRECIRARRESISLAALFGNHVYPYEKVLIRNLLIDSKRFNDKESVQQVDSAEPSTNAVPPSMPSGSAR